MSVLWKMDSYRERNIVVDLLVMTFGISAWVGVTGIFLQLPQIVQTAPEGWNLPSYIVILAQSGNIASFIYIIYVKWSTAKIDDAYFIYITLGIGCLAAILMALFYRNTNVIDGQERSIPLFIFTGMFAIVGCMSSVLFMPFMGRFRGIYLVTYMLGQGLNGLLSSLLSLVQGVGSPNCLMDNQTDTATVVYTEAFFPPNIYFLFVFCIFILSILAFLLLNKMEICKKESAITEAESANQIYEIGDDVNEYQSIPSSVFYLSNVNFYYLMVIIGLLASLSYGILPGIQTFSCLSYGTSAYHLSTTLSSLADPLACLLSLYISRPTVSDITVLTSLSAVLSAYILLTAVESPTPPLHSSGTGHFVIVCNNLNNI